jgi:hypothetical protein
VSGVDRDNGDHFMATVGFAALNIADSTAARGKIAAEGHNIANSARSAAFGARYHHRDASFRCH